MFYMYVCMYGSKRDFSFPSTVQDAGRQCIMYYCRESHYKTTTSAMTLQGHCRSDLSPSVVHGRTVWQYSMSYTLTLTINIAFVTKKDPIHLAKLVWWGEGAGPPDYGKTAPETALSLSKFCHVASGYAWPGPGEIAYAADYRPPNVDLPRVVLLTRGCTYRMIMRLAPAERAFFTRQNVASFDYRYTVFQRCRRVNATYLCTFCVAPGCIGREKKKKKKPSA